MANHISDIRVRVPGETAGFNTKQLTTKPGVSKVYCKAKVISPIKGQQDTRLRKYATALKSPEF